MKLILFSTLLINFAASICAQKYQQEQFLFPSQFSTPSSSIFTSDSSFYLPPESQTAIPYFTMNNMKNLPLELLSTGNRAAPIYPTSLPLYLSSTLRFEGEEDENNHNEISNNATPIPNRVPQSRANNVTEKTTLEKKDNKLNVKIMNQQMPLQKFDNKLLSIRSNDIAQAKNVNPASRRMIITSEIQKTDQSPDILKASSYHNPQYIQAPGIFISSTTEPAIPILRLSNEMDLDGSFSYEALGADQTHYVQHSRMENMGTDKEEQVVEGSYSYVGDDGRTYTVHYVADSNGFRATGDHLPVSPPIPEIIQRAVQYNLAEEAKRPPHLKLSWENEYENERNKEFEINERNNYIPPPRNLFTGKTPEAFSFGFSQGSKAQNNLASAASFQVPSKINYENLTDKPKAKTHSVPIAPQVTFLASQGAHSPSTQTQSHTKIINPEKSSLPQLMNYEAAIKDSEQEANKALWRWQYGLNTNINENQKNSISRSSSGGDDVIINFSDMTPGQYTQMMQTEILPQNVGASNSNEYLAGQFQLPTIQNFDSKVLDRPPKDDDYVSTEVINLYKQDKDGFIKSQQVTTDFYKQIHKQEDKSISEKENINSRSEIINRYSFTPPSQIATQSYDFKDFTFKSSKINISNENTSLNLRPMYETSNNDILSKQYYENPTTVEPLFNTPNNIKQISVSINEDNSHFKPMTYNGEKEIKQETTTTERTMDEMLRENVYLRNLFKQSHNKEKMSNTPSVEHYKFTNYENKQNESDKESKHFKFQRNPHNDIKVIKSKPLDVNNILNYVIMKNHFESIKTKQNNKPVHQLNQNMNGNEMLTHYIPIKVNDSYDLESNNDDSQKQDYKMLDQQQQQDLQGIIKNYKVLQRQKNAMQRSQLLSEPLRHIKAFHTQSLPPLGRAGPSMKSYLPPTYL